MSIPIAVPLEGAGGGGGGLRAGEQQIDLVASKFGFKFTEWEDYVKENHSTLNERTSAVHGLPVVEPTGEEINPKDLSQALSAIKIFGSQAVKMDRTLERLSPGNEMSKIAAAFRNGYIRDRIRSMEASLRDANYFDNLRRQARGKAPSRLAIGDSGPLSLDESIKLRQKNAQCTLINNFDTLVASNGMQKERPTSNLIMHYTGPPDDLPTLITNPFNAKDFVSAGTDQLSMLSPKLDFFIRDENGKDNRVLFADYVDSERMVELSNLRDQNNMASILKASGMQGTNVGIRSFEWKYENKDWGDYVVGASLQLHFGSLTELVNESYLEFVFTSGLRHGNDTINRNDAGNAKAKKLVKIRKEIKELKKGLAAAAAGTFPEVDKTTASANFKQLKVVCGWHKPETSNLDTSILSKNFLRAIEESQKTLLLNLVSYNLEFKEQGQVDLSLEYIASIDNMAVRETSDVLAGRAGIKDNPNRKPIKVALNDEGSSFAQKSAEALGLLESAKFEDTIDPEGYIAKRFKAAQGKPERFTCAPDGVLVELDLLERQIELARLQNSSNPPNIDNLVKYSNTANEIYDQLQNSILADKYASFMDSLVYSKKVFSVTSNIVAVNNTSTTPQFRIVVTSGPPTDVGALADRLNKAAKSYKDKKDKESIDDYVNRIGALDPASDVTYEKNTKRVGNERIVTVPLYYMRLGDIIEIAMRNGNVQRRDDFRMILGSFDTASAAFPGSVKRNVPLGEIPISLDYFGQWFFENVIATETRSLKFRKFMELLCWGLVNPLLSNLCDEDNRVRLNVQFTTHTTNVREKDRLKEKTDSSTLTKKQARGVSRAGSEGMYFGDAEEVEASGRPEGFAPKQFFSQQQMKRMFNGSNRRSVLKDAPLDNFLIFFAKNMSKERKGDFVEDSKDGIYHLFVGADAGIAKQFNFATKNLSMMREMNIERAASTSRQANVLILPQDVDITMVGNTLFRNGSLIYVNAEMAIGTAAADMLQLGGYYRVYRVTNDIAPGRFQTTVNCYFQHSRVFNPNEGR